MKTKNRQGDAKADKSGSDLQNETPQKTEVQASSFRGVLFGINRLMSRLHLSKASASPRMKISPCGGDAAKHDVDFFQQRQSRR
jgi:hypothetical protein